MLHSTVASSANNQLKEKCEAWLSEHYKSYSHSKTIREYDQDSEYHYRANYHIVPYYGSPTTIGYDCTIYREKGEVIAFPSLEPYKTEPKKSSKISPSSQEHRLRYGSDACPELDSWKSISDELKKGNYSAKLSSSCISLEEGAKVYGPEKEVEYDGRPFVLISTPKGKKYWIEGGSIYK